MHTQLATQLYLTRVKPWLLVGKELEGQFLELKKGKDRNGKTGLNPSKDVRRSEIARQLCLGILQVPSQLYLLRKTSEKLNFCNIMDLQLKLSTSKATSTTVQDVHPDIARGMVRKRPDKLTICLRPDSMSATKRGLSDCSIFFYLYLLPVSCLELFCKCCQVRQQLGIFNYSNNKWRYCTFVPLFFY